jgi:vancomycin permeability regulator SanA
MMRRINRVLSGVLLCLPLMSFALNNAASYTTQAQVVDLQQQALSALSQGGNLKQNESKIFLGVTIKGNLDKAQAVLQHAANLVPERQDLTYALASVEVMNGNLSAARLNYSRLEQQTPQSVDALTFQSGYAAVAGESQLAQRYQIQLSALNTPAAKHNLQALAIAESAFTLQPKVDFSKSVNPSAHSVIVILGYALHSDGSMDDKLIQRLEVGLATLQQNPLSKIIVSGGVAQGGVTETYLMRQWLIEHGVKNSQVILEDKSIDTVSNALNSLALVQKLGDIDHVIVVSSSSHIRRAVAVFEQASANLNLALTIDNQAAWDWGNLKTSPEASLTEKSLILRDTLRTAGLWALPGVLR